MVYFKDRSLGTGIAILEFLFSLLASIIAAPLPTHAQDIAFVNVNVVPMDRERVLEAQTVWISGGHIREIGAVRKVKLPKDTLRIDGTSKYLMPGLADMHGHLTHRGPEQRYPLETFPLLLIAHGVTTLRNMAGYSAILSLRQQIEAGTTLGPRIFTTGPVLEGRASLTANNSSISPIAAAARAPDQVPQTKFLETADEATAAVRQQARDGYDAIKVYNLLPKPAYDAVIRTAGDVGLPVYGHVPRSVGLAGVLSSHIRSIEHLTGYLEALQAEDSPFKNVAFSQSTVAMAQHVDFSKLPGIAQATRDAGVWNCPTLVVLSIGTLDEASARRRLQLPVMRYVAPARLQVWEDRIRALNGKITPQDLTVYAAAHDVQMKIVKALHDAGARLLAGTDFAANFLVPGYSLDEELQMLVSAGLSPYESLRTATADAAEFLKKSDDFGTISPGKRADLLLVSANPLDDVRNAARLEGVMVRGRWYTKAELHSRLEALAASFTKP